MIPKHLYVKTHNQTGLRYFGMTTKDPFKYLGSGFRWLRHLRVHGTDISTEVVGTFTDQDEATRFAVRFSNEHDVVASDEWANLIPENGLGGRAPGTSHTADARRLMSNKSIERWADPDYRARLAISQSKSWTEGRRATNGQVQAAKWTDERRAEQSEIDKLRWKDPAVREQYAAFRPPMHRSEAHKSNIAAALAGAAKSDNHKASLSRARQRRDNDPGYVLHDGRFTTKVALLSVFLSVNHRWPRTTETAEERSLANFVYRFRALNRQVVALPSKKLSSARREVLDTQAPGWDGDLRAVTVLFSPELA